MSLLSLLPIIITVFGAYLIVRLRFFFVLHPVHTAKKLGEIIKSKSGRKSLSLALAGTLGVGNIVGVAYGIGVGGAGCVFWILVSSIFASVIKYAESLISEDMRSDAHGGMMYVIQGSFGKIGRGLGIIYAVLCLMLSLSMGAALQAQSALESASVALKISPYPFAVALVALVSLVIVGGARKIEDATAIIIPFATIVYILVCFFVIFLNVKRLPSTLFEIINGAFNIKSAAGGIGAYVISASLKEGYARGLLSNEAGAGTSAMAQTRGGGRDPVQTGLLGMCEVFFDTVVLCTLTGLAVLTSGVSLSSRSGIEIVLSAVAVSFGDVSRIIVFVLVLLFAYSTVICWYYYGGECILYLFGNGKSRIFTVVYILAVLLGAFIPSDNIIIFTDYLLFFLCILTALALIKNSERIFSLSERYGLLKKSKHSDVGEKSVSARCNR